jgi:glycosyltransferase involved in cell wall biosynthesis
VYFLGQVTGQAKLELYSRASLFLLPSYGENLPYALLEAMSIGLPVITTPVGAIPELVKEGCNGFLINPGDYQTLAERILRILDDPSIQEKMRQANIEKIKREYLPQAAMVRFDDIYKKLLSES